MEEEVILITEKLPKMMEENDKVEYVPEAALIDIRQMNERIDHMKIEEVNESLVRYSIVPKGDLNDGREQLKNIYKALTLSTINFSVSKNLLPYYVVIDFEATCDELPPPNFRPEIIEFAAVIVSSKAQKIIDCFQMYCKPQINPILTEYCLNLTGITQELVDSAETFDTVLTCFHNWITHHDLKRYGIVTDGPWDTARYLFNQCCYSNIPFPNWGRKWINLKTVLRYFYKDCFKEKIQRLCLTSMLEILNMEFVGRQHCGLDDAKNLARVLLGLIYDGANIQFNERIKPLSGSESKSPGSGNYHREENKNYFKNEFSLTKDKNIVRAQFTSMRCHNQPMPTYFTCRKAKQKHQVFLASNMSNPSAQFPDRPSQDCYRE